MSPPPSPAALLPSTVLDIAMRADPARVLLTFYDDATGERAELSVATFANWVAKTANLARDELGLDVGDRVAIDLPVHWQAAVWIQACWVSGLVAVPVPSDPVPSASKGSAMAVLPSCAAAVVAISDDRPGAEARRPAVVRAAGEVVGLGLGPLGLPVRGMELPPEVTVDFDREVHSHGDRFGAPGGLTAEMPAVQLLGEPLSSGDVATEVQTASARWALGAGDRVLSTAALDNLSELLAVVLVPLATGSAAVLCRHLDALEGGAFQDGGESTLGRRFAQEGVTAVTSGSRFVSAQRGFVEARVRRLD
jgi:uncharacterized protein (TIGR03089 family)